MTTHLPINLATDQKSTSCFILSRITCNSLSHLVQQPRAERIARAVRPVTSQPQRCHGFQKKKKDTWNLFRVAMTCEMHTFSLHKPTLASAAELGLERIAFCKASSLQTFNKREANQARLWCTWRRGLLHSCGVCSAGTCEDAQNKLLQLSGARCSEDPWKVVFRGLFFFFWFGLVSESSKPDLAVGALLVSVPLTEQVWKDVLYVCRLEQRTHSSARHKPEM